MTGVGVETRSKVRSMAWSMARSMAAGVAAGVAGAGGLVAVGSGSPGPAGADTCGIASGVSVVVDFGSLGGGAQTGCAPGDPTSGLAALQSAGFGYSFVPSRPGFVCRVNGLPDPCNGAPAHAYWSYWYAPPGGSWAYANIGAGSRDPAPGSVEGWAFGDGDAPGVSPPQAPQPAPAPAPGPSPTVAPGPAPAPTQPPPAQPAATQPSTDAPNPSSAPTPTAGPGAGVAPVATESPSSGTGGIPSAGTTAVPPDGVSSLPASEPPAGEGGGADGVSRGPTTTVSGEARIATSPLSATGDEDENAGPSLGAVAGLVLVVAIGVGAIGSSRRRSRNDNAA